jgi:hypothetical protein
VTVPNTTKQRRGNGLTKKQKTTVMAVNGPSCDSGPTEPIVPQHICAALTQIASLHDAQITDPEAARLAINRTSVISVHGDQYAGIIFVDKATSETVGVTQDRSDNPAISSVRPSLTENIRRRAALNFNARGAGVFDGEFLLLGLVFALYTALACRSLDRKEQFRDAFADRDIIAQARGFPRSVARNRGSPASTCSACCPNNRTRDSPGSPNKWSSSQAIRDTTHAERVAATVVVHRCSSFRRRIDSD